MQLLKCLGILFALAIVADGLYLICFVALKPSELDYASVDEYKVALVAASLTARLIVTPVVLGALMLVLRAVGYRKRDALMSLIPIYGTVFLVKIAWRIASLPDRYWSVPQASYFRALVTAPAPWDPSGGGSGYLAGAPSGYPGTSPPVPRATQSPGWYPVPGNPGWTCYWDGAVWIGEATPPAPTPLG